MILLIVDTTSRNISNLGKLIRRRKVRLSLLRCFQNRHVVKMFPTTMIKDSTVAANRTYVSIRMAKPCHFKTGPTECSHLFKGFIRFILIFLWAKCFLRCNFKITICNSIGNCKLLLFSWESNISTCYIITVVQIQESSNSEYICWIHRLAGVKIFVSTGMAKTCHFSNRPNWTQSLRLFKGLNMDNAAIIAVSTPLSPSCYAWRMYSVLWALLKVK